MNSLSEALEKLANKQNENLIGKLSEKSVHSCIKYMICLDESCHEVKVDNFFCDVVVNNHIYEVQSKGFDKIRKKLEKLLLDHKVTIVYPVIRNSYLEIEEGYSKKNRKSPKIGHFLDFFNEAYKIKYLLKNPNLDFKLIMMDVIDIRVREQKRLIKIDKYPINIIEVIDLIKVEDYLIFLKGLVEFNSKEFAEANKVNIKTAQIALNVLYYLDLVDRVKTGREFIYKVS